MNPLYRSTARLAFRTLKTSSPITTRPFSIAAGARLLKSQIFETNSVIKNGAKADWGRVARHITGASVL